MSIVINNANTFNTLMKEYMAKMPDNIDSKKECDEYYKTGSKEIKEKLKDEKKTEKVVTTKNNEEPKKRVKKINVDDDGNEIEKVKKLPNAYNKFIQEQRPNVKNDFPELNNKELFSKIAEMWKNHKEDIKKNNNSDDNNSDGYQTAEEDSEEDDKKADDKKADDKKADDNKADDKKADDEKADDEKEDNKKAVNKKAVNKKGEGKKKEGKKEK